MKEKLLKYSIFFIIGTGSYFLFVLMFSHTRIDFDIWGYLSFGKIFWEKHYFPYQDIFSYTPTKSLWIYHEWLTGVILYPILKYSGPAGIQLLRYIIIVVTLYLIYFTALKKGASVIPTFICLSFAIVLLSFGYVPVVRAHVFTYLFFILTIYIAEVARKNQRWLVLLWILPLQILWCNLHGGFVAGLGLIGIYALGESLSGRKFIPFIIILLPACLVTLINPYGLEYWKYIVDAVTMPRPEINEWFSVWLSLKTNYMFNLVILFIPLSILCLLLFILQRKRYLTETLIIAVTCYLGFKHVRHIMLFALVFGSFMPVVVSELWDNLFKEKIFNARRFWLLPVTLIIFFVSINSLTIKLFKINEFSLVPSFSLIEHANLYPVGALQWMGKHRFQGNILPLFQWGEYLIWACYPKCKVAMDGRYETVYLDQVNTEYFNFIMGREGWHVFLNKYPHDAVLVQTNSKIHELMLQQTQWKPAYTDSYSVLFIRQ